MRTRVGLLALLVTACATAPVATSTTQTPRTTSVSVVSTTVTTPVSTSIPPTTSTPGPDSLTIEVFPVPAGSDPHDVAPAADGGVWYTSQATGELGHLDPLTGETFHIPLGEDSAPHGVIVDDDGMPWITDGGLNAIVAVDPETFEVTVYPLPDDEANANLNTATFGSDGRLWFTGQDGIYGVLDLATGETEIFQAPQGRGPYGITATRDGRVFYASLAGSYIGAIQSDGSAEVLEPPSPDQGARRVWSDSSGDIWVSEWNTGNLTRYRPDLGEWDSVLLPGDNPAAYAVYVDDEDIVWASDFGSNSIVRFDPVLQAFNVYPLPADPGEVRQIHGRPGEVWGAQSADDSLILIRTR